MRLAILFLILIFLIDLLGFYLGPLRPYYYDMLLHFSGGIFVAMFFTAFFKNRGLTATLSVAYRDAERPDKSFRKAEFLTFGLVILSATVLVGAFWEFLEYLATAYFGGYLAEKYGIICCIGNLGDTISDLALDAFGAIAFIALKQLIKINKD